MNTSIKSQVRSITVEMPYQSLVFQSELLHRRERNEITQDHAKCWLSPQRQLCIWTPSIRHVITEEYCQPVTQGLNPVFLSFEDSPWPSHGPQHPLQSLQYLPCGGGAPAKINFWNTPHPQCLCLFVLASFASSLSPVQILHRSKGHLKSCSSSPVLEPCHEYSRWKQVLSL